MLKIFQRIIELVKEATMKVLPIQPTSPYYTDDIYTVIKTLLNSRLNATLAELKKDYEEKVGDNRLPRNYSDLRRLMISMADNGDVQCVENAYGLEIWQVNRSSIKQSEYTYMKKKGSSSSGMTQKRPRRHEPTSNSRNRRSRMSTSRNSSISPASQPRAKRKCYDQPSSKSSHQHQHQQQQQQQQPFQKKLYQKDADLNLLSFRSHTDIDGYLGDYQLMGDDFMLSLAKIDLGFKFQKDPVTGRLCIGYSVSGLTVKRLERIVRSLQIDTKAIVYIGTVDILLGASLTSLQHDFTDLLSAFRERGVEPVLCTLAPIGEEGNIYDGLITEFNNWLTTRNWTVADVNRCFIGEDGKPIRKVYQKDPRKVSGCHVRHLLWNKLGRQRVLKCLSHFIGIPTPRNR
ncbi:maternal effect protein oskar [Culicoides brevitarsis]|uniref:maternal effect protein oskar n=1 Tax=Culicoides brevitarsis TaxID=469753 RepID=UPI00307B5D77